MLKYSIYTKFSTLLLYYLFDRVELRTEYYSMILLHYFIVVLNN